METKNTCYTYFYVSGKISFLEFVQKLNLPVNCINLIKDSSDEDENTALSIGRNDIYDVYVDNMLKISLKHLFGKEHLLKELKEKYNLTYYLSVVPTMIVNEINQSLFISKEIIEFCYKSNTEIDIDLYLLKD